jgi:HPt (histidine-containing phosphotransfer) domain-containing protein
MVTDLTYLKNMSGGNNGFVKEMIGIFTEQVHELEDSLKTALAKQDYEQLGKHAHKAKSTVSIMGMESLAADLKSLELWAPEAKEIDKYHSIVDRFILDTKEAVIELNKIVKELK